MSWGVEDKKKSSENIAIIKVKLYIDAKVVKEMRIATWMFPERGSEQGAWWCGHLMFQGQTYGFL